MQLFNVKSPSQHSKQIYSRFRNLGLVRSNITTFFTKLEDCRCLFTQSLNFKMLLYSPDWISAMVISAESCSNGKVDDSQVNIFQDNTVDCQEIHWGEKRLNIHDTEEITGPRREIQSLCFVLSEYRHTYSCH